ncbi:MAG: pyridoxal phosphate-dependent aminotransferase [Bacteroidaceae bacterium]|nr:pyridoxal phosphate-dependent aminotransferase [Bacteroidaceae bacterium]
MPYNFDEMTHRRGTDCAKWDETAEEVIPLWVADMDFRAPQPVIDALRRRVEHGIFGYAHVPQAYFDAVCSWFHRRHNWTVRPEEIIYTTGVIPALAAALRAVTLPGEKVLLQTPVYNCFFSSLRNAGCEALDSPLLYGADSRYTIDFADFERKAADPRCTAFLLCNPHNPAGRVWTDDELRRLGDICQRHGVRVIADEIHCELVMPGHTFRPFASLDAPWAREAVTLNSPTKNFNIAGLQVANIITPDPLLRRRIDRAINLHETCDLNAFAADALIAAYNESENWLVQLNAYLWDNYRYLQDFVAHELPQCRLTVLEGTYLAWLDVRPLGIPTRRIEAALKARQKVWVNSGTLYGTEGFLRINLATQRSRLAEGLRRMAEGLRELSAQG